MEYERFCTTSDLTLQDSGGVMDRIVSQLLAELSVSTANPESHLFVIGATNRPDLIDPALLVPGRCPVNGWMTRAHSRFDKLIYLGVSTTPETQLPILEALTRKFDLSPETNIAQIIERCPRCLTGLVSLLFIDPSTYRSRFLCPCLRCDDERHRR